MKDLQSRLGSSIIFITHDLGVIAQLCTRVIVMYGGMVMEEATVDELFYDAKNPYTIGLLNSVPNPKADQKERLEPIPGTPPDLLNPPKGCPFCNRCKFAMKKCMEELPKMYEISGTHKSRCHLLHPEAPKVEGFVKEARM